MKTVFITIMALAMCGCNGLSNTYPGSTSRPDKDFIAAFAEDDADLFDWESSTDMADGNLHHVVGKMKIEEVVFVFDFAIENNGDVLLVEVTEDGDTYFIGPAVVDDSNAASKVKAVDKMLRNINI